MFSDRATSASPSARMPEPASMMMVRRAQVISTQAVLPPKAIVSGPGEGMLPRTPQNLRRNCSGPMANSWYRRFAGPSRPTVAVLKAPANRHASTVHRPV